MRIINIKNTKLKPIIQDEMLEVQGKFLVENNYGYLVPEFEKFIVEL